MNHEKARIWFFTDIHGSNACFRKFLNAVKHDSKPNVLIIGGDITGKQIVPIVKTNNGNFCTFIGGKRQDLDSSEISNLKKTLSDFGYYTYECDEQQYDQFKFSPDTAKTVFDNAVKERLTEWVTWADEKLPSSEECQVFINAGNDDSMFVDEILDKSSKLIHSEGKVFDLPCGLKLLSTGYANKTPWNCPRDIEEEHLTEKIALMTAQLTQSDRGKTIFNLHCPPKGTALDLANKIDPETLKPIPGIKGSQKEHVGSTAVYNAIETMQPLVSLHGHIHEVHTEARIGKTICFNPGSDYRNGRLQGIFLQINNIPEIELSVLTMERDPQTAKTESIVDSLIHIVPGVGHAFSSKQTLDKLNEVDEKLDKIIKGQSDDANKQI